MTSDDGEAIESALHGLPVLEPERARAERIRARCRARIAARGPAGTAGRRMVSIAGLEAALLSGFGAVYLLAILYLALAVPAVR